MSPFTTNPTDRRLGTGVDVGPTEQYPVYLILSDVERAKGFTRPFRTSYRHLKCGSTTRMADPLAATYARSPEFYGATYCVKCRRHLPVDEFEWVERDGSSGSRVGT